MKKKTWRKGLAVMLGLLLGIQLPLGAVPWAERAYAYTARSATVNASSLNVRSGPGTSYGSVMKLSRGTAVTVINEATASDGKLWYQIRFTGSGGTSNTGYVLSTYIRFPVSYSHDTDFESYLQSQGFPESYKDGLRQLHAQYPNWVFTAYQTGLDWNTVIQNESVLGRNLVASGSISSYKSLIDGAYDWDNGTWVGFDGSSWVMASEDLIRYYMDPRNFLDEVSVFQFLSQEYDASLHTRDGLQSMLNGTFMEGALKTYGSGSSTSSGSTSSGSTSSGSSGGPGVSGGPGMSSGNGSSSSSGTTSPVVTPGGQSAVVVSPGSGSSSGSGSSGNSGSGSTDGGVTFQAPTSGGDSDVRLVGPQASVSRHDTVLVGTVITAGPSAAGGSTSVTPGAAPGSSAATAPGDTTSADSSGVTYADVIMQAAASSGVNPYVLAAMIIQEQGSDGRGNSISGNYSGYTGYYNYFNVGAYASDGMTAVQRGLWYASQSGNYGRPWNSVQSSIVGGAEFYGSNYVRAGQDTLYLKKFNVQGSNMYKHQYMTNVDGAASEGCIFAEGFSAELKATALEFKIPVYQNMPDSPCAKPTQDGSPNNKLKGLGAEGFALTPTFNRDTYSYDLIVDQSVANVAIYANAIDSKASVSGTGNVALQSGINEISVVVRAENGSERKYVIHVVRQNNGPTYNASIAGGSTSSGSAAVNPGGPGAAGPGTTGGTSSVVTAGSGPGSTTTTPASGNSSQSGVTYSSPSSGDSEVRLVSPGG